jgi:hypothetical protein
MMKNKGRDKAVKPGDFTDRGPDPAAVEFVCIQECNVPNVGTWRAGDRISDPAVIAKISGSPCFKPAQEVE